MKSFDKNDVHLLHSNNEISIKLEYSDIEYFLSSIISNISLNLQDCFLIVKKEMVEYKSTKAKQSFNLYKSNPIRGIDYLHKSIKSFPLKELCSSCLAEEQMKLVFRYEKKCFKHVKPFVEKIVMGTKPYKIARILEKIVLFKNYNLMMLDEAYEKYVDLNDRLVALDEKMEGLSIDGRARYEIKKELLLEELEVIKEIVAKGVARNIALEMIETGIYKKCGVEDDKVESYENIYSLFDDPPRKK